MYALVLFAKYVSVIVFTVGCVGAIVPGPLERRRRFGYIWASLGLGACWVLGFLLVYFTATSLLSGWILWSLVLSVVSLQAVLYVVGAEGRLGWVSRSLVIAPLLGTIALMVLQP
ncbi:MAG: hypothetical protein KC543_07175 [Myxococcales bacterium]|nr:hypothetical protein [Myxococcales bacterium]